MAVLSYAIIGLSIIGLAIGFLKLRTRTSWARKVIFGSALVGFLAGAYVAYAVLFRPAIEGIEVESRSQSYAKAGTLKLGRYLAEKFPGSKALVILPLPHPYCPGGFETPARRDALVEGLREGFGGRIAIQAVVAPEFPEIVKRAWQPPRGYPNGYLEENLLPPLDSWFDADYLDRYVKSHDACDLIVSLAGLPADYRIMSSWRKDPRPRLALWFPERFEDGYRLRNIIAAGDVDAVAVRRPEFDPRSGKGDPSVPYVDRFVVLTPENAEAMPPQPP